MWWNKTHGIKNSNVRTCLIYIEFVSIFFLRHSVSSSLALSLPLSHFVATTFVCLFYTVCKIYLYPSHLYIMDWKVCLLHVRWIPIQGLKSLGCFCDSIHCVNGQHSFEWNYDCAYNANKFEWESRQYFKVIWWILHSLTILVIKFEIRKPPYC